MSMTEAEQAAVFDKVKSLLIEGDSFEAVSYVNGLGEPLEVARHYASLVGELYSKERSVPSMLFLGRAGLQYCLTKADDLAVQDPDLSRKLKGAAKVISFNLSANTWPGWGDEGITFSRQDSIAGLDAAKLNLRMVRELGEGPDPLSVSHWAIGSQYMALGEYEKALAAFEASKGEAIVGNNKAGELLALGYIGITNILAKQIDRGKGELDEAIAGLEGLDTEDSRFFIDQLKTALDIFSS
ncbi:MAG: hypothetical protein JW941_09275 [Candidatus Coatesbacteria bacterium]|nr:hypothetical protein [Candidatus Coatesbacteria bacterium]